MGFIVLKIYSQPFYHSKMKSQQRTSTTQVNDQNKLIQYLDEFGKQISSRKHSNALEQQLSSLSKAYNQAQQKLLQTQKALMGETLLLEKQRSVIELYKYILGQDMEDQGILTFLQHLEEEETKTEIYEELTELKTLLTRKNLKNCRKSIEDDKTVKELKKEVSKLHEQKRSCDEESQIINNQNYELNQKLSKINIEMAHYKTSLQTVQNQLEKRTKELEHCQNQLISQKKQRRNKELALQELTKKQTALRIAKDYLEQIQNIISSKLSISSLLIQNKQNIINHNLQSHTFSISREYLKQIDQKLNQLLKYKQNYKKIKENIRQCELHKRQISILKLFISQQALNLIKQYQIQSIDCLQTELRNLAVIQKNKILRLQDCERDLWKYRIQLIRQEESSSLLHSQQILNRNSRMLSSKQPTNTCTVLPPHSNLILSGNSHNISEFTSEL